MSAPRLLAPQSGDLLAQSEGILAAQARRDRKVGDPSGKIFDLSERAENRYERPEVVPPLP